MSGFIQEFKAFAVKGNMIDLAVGFIMGTAFNKVVSSLVKDMIMPVIGNMLGGVNFSHLYIQLGAKTYESLEIAEKAGAPIIKYGAFINHIIDFLIIALAVFVVVKIINNMKKKEEAKPVAPSDEVVLLTEIRDNIKK